MPGEDKSDSSHPLISGLYKMDDDTNAQTQSCTSITSLLRQMGNKIVQYFNIDHKKTQDSSSFFNKLYCFT